MYIIYLDFFFGAFEILASPISHQPSFGVTLHCNISLLVEIEVISTAE